MWRGGVLRAADGPTVLGIAQSVGGYGAAQCLQVVAVEVAQAVGHAVDEVVAVALHGSAVDLLLQLGNDGCLVVEEGALRALRTLRTRV